MKLISCNVENFGTLQNYQIDFNQGLTVLNEENGFGKSTLAVFIKAMFYGLPVVTKRSLDENERKKYTPWQKGVFGGSLDFEKGGKKYRIERFFGDKEKDDTVTVFDLDSGREYNGFGEDIGTVIFGIDAESFERSVYMPQRNTALKINSSLSAKLTGLVENSDDINNFDNAYKTLTDRAKQYVPLRGAGGTVNEKQAEIDRLKQDVAHSKASAENLARLEGEIEGLKATHNELSVRQKEIRDKITAVSDIAARQVEAKQYRDLSDSLKNVELKIASLNTKYPNGLPTDTEIAEIEENIKALNRAETELSVLKNNTADRHELDSLIMEYGKTLPTEQKVDEIKNKNDRLTGLKIKAESLTERLSSAGTTHTAGSKSVKLLAVVAVLLLSAGAGICVWKLAVGIAVLALGIVLSGVAAFMYLKNMITVNSGGENPKTLLAESERLNAEIETLSNEVAEFVSHLSVQGETGKVLDEISIVLRDVERLKKSVRKQEDDIAVCIRKISEIKAVLNKFFAKFGQSGEDYSVFVDSVKSDKRNMALLKSDQIKFKEKISEMPKIKEIPETDEASNREQLIFEEQKIGSHLTDLVHEITKKENEAGRLLTAAELLGEYDEQLENAEQELVELKSRYNVLVTTAQLLEKAKNDLSMRYVDRMKQDFGKYSEILGAEFKDTLLDSDLNLKVKDGGAARTRESYSEGFRDMMDIAMRLSLSDAMFEGEEVMLILDDPFVNLDDKRLRNAMELLKKLAENRQIIYLTCHSSRS